VSIPGGGPYRPRGSGAGETSVQVPATADQQPGRLARDGAGGSPPALQRGAGGTARGLAYAAGAYQLLCSGQAASRDPPHRQLRPGPLVRGIAAANAPP